MAQALTQGQRIRRMRLEKRYTQDYVAAQLNTTKQAIYKYEADIVKNIPTEKLLQLAQLFGCSATWLQGLSEDMGRTAPAAPVADAHCGVPRRTKSDPATPVDDQFVFYRNFMDLTLRLTPEDRQSILLYTRFLLSQHETAEAPAPDQP